VAVVLALCGLWAWVTHAGHVSPAYLAAPDAALRALVRGYTHADWWRLTGHTVLRLLQGWGLACVIGLLLGALIGSSARLRTWLQPTLEMLRPLPSPALLPLAVALWGLTPKMVLAVVVMGSVWPPLLATAQGVVARIDPRLHDVRRMLRLSRSRFLLQVALPAVLPDALAGMRVALAVALIVATVGEMLSSMPGMGFALLLAARSFQSAELFGGVMVLGLIGLAGNGLLLALERRALRWQHV
jgi:ABC-type nitrate/sulfonate/bicarbonate transport system permease component